MSIAEFWMSVYANAIRSGVWNDLSARNIADAAVMALRDRFDLPPNYVRSSGPLHELKG